MTCVRHGAFIQADVNQDTRARRGPLHGRERVHSGPPVIRTPSIGEDTGWRRFVVRDTLPTGDPRPNHPRRRRMAYGTCPYCRTLGAFRVNLTTGKWVCLPSPSPESGTPKPRRATGRGARPRGDRRGDSEAPATASPPGGRGGGTEWARLSYRRRDRIAARAAPPDSWCRDRGSPRCAGRARRRTRRVPGVRGPPPRRGGRLWALPRLSRRGRQPARVVALLLGEAPRPPHEPAKDLSGTWSVAAFHRAIAHLERLALTAVRAHPHACGALPEGWPEAPARRLALALLRGSPVSREALVTDARGRLVYSDGWDDLRAWMEELGIEEGPDAMPGTLAPLMDQVRDATARGASGRERTGCVPGPSAPRGGRTPPPGGGLARYGGLKFENVACWTTQTRTRPRPARWRRPRMDAERAVAAGR